MYNSDFFDPHHYPRDWRDTHPIYDYESHHAVWHPGDLIRERALEELTLASHELENLELSNLQLERERAMALHNPRRYGIEPGYEFLEPYSVRDRSLHGSYPGYGVMHAPLYDHPPIPLVNDPLYHRPTYQSSRGVPVMDPYSANPIMAGPTPVQFPVDSMRNPFSSGIDHDFGYGPIEPLASYGLTPGELQPGYGRYLDDLYFYEMLLRLDQTIDEQERILRWRERLAWEELGQAERQLLWQRMSLMERSRLGLGAGSHWGYDIAALPIDTAFGYSNPLLGLEVLEYYQPLGDAPIMGVCGCPHYPISPALLSQYPMWNVGGMGLGTRISAWLGDLGWISPRKMIRRENMLRDYAERRGEIPPGFRLAESGAMGAGIPPYPAYV